jgi:uncharacterized repeat protein (TIGR03803 family)
MKIMIRHVSRKVIITLGIVCSLATAGAYGQTFTILHTFRGSPDAGYPVAGVLLDGRGNIYGVTMFDGANQEGAVFRIDSDGEETVLHSFGTSPSDGVFPEGGLVADAEGNVYGTTGAARIAREPCSRSTAKANIPWSTVSRPQREMLKIPPPG